MFKINISQQILEKHRRYIRNEKIFIKLDEFKRAKIDWPKDKKNKIKLDEEHIGLCCYLQKQIMDLEKYNIEELQKCNIFLGRPKILNLHKMRIYKKFPNISDIINEKVSVTVEGEKQAYNIILLECMGYNNFSQSELEDYNQVERRFIQEYTSSGQIKTKLKEIRSLRSESKYNKIHAKILLEQIIARIEELIKFNSREPEIQRVMKNIIIGLNSIDITQNKDDVIAEVISNIEHNQEELYSRFFTRVINNNNYKEYFIRNNINSTDWNAYHFVFELGLNICPYCNRQYISPIHSEHGKMRADLDHFFSKAQYPYLSISIFNLVPSCKFCNSSIKGAQNFDYEKFINPYEYDISEMFNFNFIPLSVQSFYGKDDFKLDIEYDEVRSKELVSKTRNNLKVFNINEIYQYHTYVIQELMIKKVIYTEKYVDWIMSTYGEKLFSNDREKVIDLIIGNTYGNMRGNICLEKLYRDIVKSLGFK